MQRPIPRRRVSGVRRTAASKPVKRRTAASRPVKRPRRAVPRPKPRVAPVPQTAHGPMIVKRAISHLKEIYMQRDCAHFVHQIFTECGLIFPETPTRYFPPMSYFVPVKTPLAGDVVVYADHMGIYARDNKIIIADPGPQLVTVAMVNSFLNFGGFYRWYQDARR